MKTLIKNIVPPILYNELKKIVPKAYGWKGNYDNWHQAKQGAEGYDKDVILERVMLSTEKVVKGEARFERDSVLFENPEYNWSFIAALMYVAAKEEGRLNIVDFGGSLGSSFFQNRPFFEKLKSVSWNIVEQSHFVNIGKSKFSNNQLNFFYSIEDAVSISNSKTLILSSVLQYIEHPYQLLASTFKNDFDTIIIDRMPFNVISKDRICIQNVNPNIYPASYPCHLLNKETFVSYIKSEGYHLLSEFDAIDGKSTDYQYKGMIFEK